MLSSRRLILRNRKLFGLRNLAQNNHKSNREIENLLETADLTQKDLLHEALILVDKNDQIIGKISKLEAHILQNGHSPLHRAFSLFHFNSKNQLLVQKRSRYKITFPSLWTNTVCSHPLYNEKEIESDEGIKHAANRRAIYECNLNIPIENLKVMQRIIYSRPMDHHLLGEHELDYCIISKGDFDFAMNENEIEDYIWLDKSQLQSFMEQSQVTPWFNLIYQSGLLDNWWRNIDSLDSIQSTQILQL